MITVWDEESRNDALSVAMQLREHGISTETYLGEGGLKAQLRYASRRQIRWCVIAGPDERERVEVTVRDLESGDQRTGQLRDVVELVRWAGS